MAAHDSDLSEDSVKRRDFIFVSAGAFGAVGTALALWPFIDQMNPAENVLALASIEVSLADIPVGQSVKVMWRGKPVFVTHRSQEGIEASRSVDIDKLPDPETDDERVVKPEWLVVVGVCTHLGCIPIVDRGDYEGWFCPCHGSHYDTSGRIRKGPAPKNLVVPPYEFVDANTVRIG